MVKVIKLDGKGTVKLPDGTEKEVPFTYDKIVTPGTKRNAGSDAEQKEADYPTFAEMAEYLGGNVEFNFKKNDKGEFVVDLNGKRVIDEEKPTAIVQFLIDGINLEYNRKAKEEAGNLPIIVLAKAKIDLMDAKTALTKAKMPTTEIDGYIADVEKRMAALEAEEKEKKAKSATSQASTS